MRIVAAELRKISLPLRKPFVIAYNTWSSMPSLILKIETDAGIVGFGECVPDEGVTGETIDGAFATLAHTLLPMIMGQDPLAIEAYHERANEIINGSFAAKAAIDIALFDIRGKVYKEPLYVQLGGPTNLVVAPAVMALTSPKQLAMDLPEFMGEGYTHFKLKLGGTDQDDYERVKIARETLGAVARIKVDANQGWGTWDRALRMIESIAPYDIELVEQPVKHWDYEGLQRVRQRSIMPIMVDEGVRDARDLLRVIRQGGVDWVNIKLMKCGGILPAVKIAALAEAAGIKVQIGSMLESSIGSLAGAHIHRALAVVKASEMVGPRLFARDIGNFSYYRSEVVFSDDPGLGVAVDEETMRWLTSLAIRIDQRGCQNLSTHSGSGVK